MFSDLHAWTFPVSISYPARSPKVRRGLTVMSGLTEVSTTLGILPSRSAALRQFRIDHNTDSIFIKEPV